MSSRVEKIMLRKFITSDDVRAAAARNESHLTLPQTCTVTDEARELALKLSIRLGEAGAAKPAAPAASAPVQPRKDAPAPDAVQQTWPEDTNRRVVEAVSQVLEGLDLGERKAILLPTIIRRVFAGLAANRS
jgi:hypothetical protein